MPYDDRAWAHLARCALPYVVPWLDPTYDLNDGSTLPAIGFGTYPLRAEDVTAAGVGAFEVGYRLLDTAVGYGNETEVGEAIRRSGVPRASST